MGREGSRARRRGRVDAADADPSEHSVDVLAGHFSEAVSELEACENRRGRAQEALGMSDSARVRYEAFLALRSDAKKDPLVDDARRRAGR